MVKLAANTLPNDINTLKSLLHAAQQQLENKDQQIETQDQRILGLQNIIEELIAEKRLAQARHFGASSEKMPLQYYLFDEAEQFDGEGLDTSSEETSNNERVEVKPHQRRPGGRKPLPEDLPRVRIEHELAVHERQCQCGCTLEKIGEVHCEQIDIIPAQVYVIDHARFKYHCKSCHNTPVVAPLPPQAIPKSQASAGFLAYIATSKYADGLPLYRQCHMFNRIGIEQQRQTLANHMIKAGTLTQPLINLLQESGLHSGYVQMDETTVQVLNEPGKSASSQSQMWVMRGGPPDKPVVTFHYDPTRRQSVPERLLADYSGYLQTDGYAGYNSVLSSEDIQGLGCLAHVRRKYTDAQKSLGKDSRQGKRVKKALGFIGQLYAIEKTVKDSDVEARYHARQQDSLPLLAEFKEWLDNQSITAKSKLGQAITYTLNQWPRLLVYCEDGRLHIDNNGIENKIRPFAVGRRNWLFSSSQRGATASANLYSLIETAKDNRLNEYAYLKHIFTELPKAECVEDFEKLLPWNVDTEKLDQLTKYPVKNT